MRAVRAGGSNLARRLRLGPRDRVVTALPLAHTYGTNVMNAALGSGADLLLLERFDAEAMLERSARHAATVMAGVPAMYRRLLSQPDGALAENVIRAVQAACSYALRIRRAVGGIGCPGG